LLFVYGSLKRGGSNHHQLGAGQLVATTRTAPRYALRVIDGYPALVPGARAILGELYRIELSALPGLDDFEGSAYVRKEIELAGSERALAYLAREPEAGAPYPADEWPEAGA
jgi:gamma-glutamylaminecyclotransferase